MPRRARPPPAAARARLAVISGPTSARRVGRVLDDQPLHRGHQRVAHGPPARGLLADHAAGGRALLAGVAHRGAGDDRRRRLEVGVGQHDGRVLAAHLALGRQRRARRPAEPPPRPGRGRPGERDRAEPGVARRAPPRRRRRPAPAGRAGPGSSGSRQAMQRLGARRRERRGFPDAGVAVRQRRRELPCRDRQREVPRRDQPDDAPRPPPGHEQRAAVARAGTSRRPDRARPGRGTGGSPRSAPPRREPRRSAFRPRGTTSTASSSARASIRAATRLRASARAWPGAPAQAGATVAAAVTARSTSMPPLGANTPMTSAGSAGFVLEIWTAETAKAWATC